MISKEISLARGGARPGAGRPKGRLSKKNAELQARVAADGITPLEVMLQTMRDAWSKGQIELACAVAKDAAPYIHPKLISSKNETEVTHHYVAEIPAPAQTDEEWQRSRLQ